MASRADIIVAAQGCYGFNGDDARRAAMQFVIESLVFPEGVDSYTEEDMERYITDALEVIGRAPR